MPKYKVTVGAKTYIFTGDTPPTDEDIDEEISRISAQPQPEPNAVTPSETSFRTKVYEGIKNLPETIASLPEKVGDLDIPGRFKETGEYLTDAYFPRTQERLKLNKKGAGNILAAGLDLATIPGRSFASLSELPYPDKVQKSMQDTKGTRLAGQILRDPMTSAAVLAAIPTGGASFWPQFAKEGVKEIPKAIAKSRAGSIVAQSAAGATAHQLANVEEDKGVSAKQTAEDFSFGLGGGLLGEGAGKVITAGINKISSKITPGRIKSAVNNIYDELNPSPSTSESGVSKEVLTKHEIIGDLKDAGIKSNNIIKRNSEIRDAAIKSTEHMAKKIMGPGYKPTVNINKLVDDISFSDDMTPGFVDEQFKALKDIVRRTEEISPDGNISLSDIPKVKHIIAKMRKFSKQPSSQSYDDVDKILGIAYKRLDDEFIKKVGDDVLRSSNKITSMTPEEMMLFRSKLQSNADAVKEANTNMHELIPVKDAIDKKIATGYYDKKPGLVKKAWKTATSMGNIGIEFLLDTTPGIPTAVRLGLLGKGELSPSIANTLIKLRDTKAGEKIIQKYMKNKTFMDKVYDDPSSKEFKSLPLYVQKYISVKQGTSPNSRLSTLQREERDLLIKLRKAAEKPPNKLQTFGTITGLGSGASRDY